MSVSLGHQSPRDRLPHALKRPSRPKVTQAARLRDPRYLKTPYVGGKGGVSLIVDSGGAAPDRLRAQLLGGRG